jgi:hypothetical protein
MVVVVLLLKAQTELGALFATFKQLKRKISMLRSIRFMAREQLRSGMSMRQSTRLMARLEPTSRFPPSSLRRGKERSRQHMPVIRRRRSDL